MGEHKHYKESGKFSPVGAVLMVLATAVCGGLLFWLYLLFEGWCTIIYLNVIAAIAVSCALGFVGGKIVRAFKMGNSTNQFKWTKCVITLAPEFSYHFGTLLVQNLLNGFIIRTSTISTDQKYLFVIW